MRHADAHGHDRSLQFRPVEAIFAGDNAPAEPLKRSAMANRGAGLRGKPLTTACPVERTRRGFSAGSRGDADQLYRAALRHSRHVRWLRLGVPAALAGALLLIVGANYMPTVGGLRLPGELGNLVIKGTKVTMQQPRLTGFTIDSRPYEFTANSAEQDITKPDFMELHQIAAKIEMEDKSMVNLTSISGTYDMKTEMLTLMDKVHLVSSTGYEARLSQAVIDVHKGTVVSDKPVWVKLNTGVINAKQLEVRDSGEVIRFTGGVSMVIQPEQDGARAPDR
jgi:lipopolysaccharide export system protein LptC